MNAKRKGTAREHRSKRILEAAGYAVMRAPGSHGLWDLVGISPTGIILCQVKSRDLPGPLERESLDAFQCPPNCWRLIQRWRDGRCSRRWWSCDSPPARRVKRARSSRGVLLPGYGCACERTSNPVPYPGP